MKTKFRKLNAVTVTMAAVSLIHLQRNEQKGPPKSGSRFGDRVPEEGLEPDRSARPGPRNLQPTKGWERDSHKQK